MITKKWAGRCLQRPCWRLRRAENALQLGWLPDFSLSILPAGGQSPEQQIATLKEIVEKSRAKDKAVPPGLHAQLGLLYSKIGNDGQAMNEFNTEKRCSRSRRRL